MTRNMRKRLKQQLLRTIETELQPGKPRPGSVEVRSWISYYRLVPGWAIQGYPRSSALLAILDADADDNTTLIEVLKS
jgi:hypothetical protein